MNTPLHTILERVIARDKDKNARIDHLETLEATVGDGIQVKEIDGAPDVSGVVIIRVSNGTLTDDGGGQVTITTGGGGDDALFLAWRGTIG